MAYTGIDKEIYDSGIKFRPLQEYTQQQWTPSQSLASTIGDTGGVTGAQAAAPYIWPPVVGGGRDDFSNIPDKPFSMGMSPGALGGKLPGFGNWVKRTAGNLGDIYDKLPTPTNILKKIITTGTDKYKDWKTQKEEEEAEQQAITRNRINQKIINTGIYKKNYIPPGLRGDPDAPGDDPTDRFGGKGHPDAPTKTPEQGGWHPGVGGNGGNSGQAAPGTGASGPPGRNYNRGGRIGLRPGGIVDAGKQYYGKEDWEIQQINRYGVSYPEFLQNQFGKGLHDMDATQIAAAADAWKAWRQSQAQGGLIGYFDGGIARLL